MDRSPVLIAVGTGGASAGMAKAIRQRLEKMLPQKLGHLAEMVFAARPAIKERWPEPAPRRRALDLAFQTGGALDPFNDQAGDAVSQWLAADETPVQNGLINIILVSNDPDELTLRAARLVGEADHIFHDEDVAPVILERARADAVRHIGAPQIPVPDGLSLYLSLAKDDKL